MKEIVVGVGGYSQFGKERDRCASIGSTLRQAQGALGIKVWISHAHIRNADRRASKAM